MFFIQSEIINLPLTINKIDEKYTFKIFYEYSNIIEHYILNRCEEDKNLLFEKYKKEIIKRFKKGMKACCYLKNREIISIFFVANTPVFIDQVFYTYHPSPSEILIIDIYTLKQFRKKGLYLMLFKRAMEYYYSQKYNFVTMWIMKHNHATIKAQIKGGFNEVIFTITSCSWLGFNIKTMNKNKFYLKNL